MNGIYLYFVTNTFLVGRYWTLNAKIMPFTKAFADDKFNPSPGMPILDSSSSAANKDMMAKTRTNEDTIICLSRKHCRKRRNCSLRVISFPQCFQKQFVVDVSKQVSME